jgi:hypothetical protein
MVLEYLIIKFRPKALDGPLIIITYLTPSLLSRKFVNAFEGTINLKPPSS